MILKLFNYTLEVNFYKTGYNRFFAKKLLNRYWLNPVTNSPKITLIKIIRAEKNISLSDAKEAIELMFDIQADGTPVIK